MRRWKLCGEAPISGRLGALPGVGDPDEDRSEGARRDRAPCMDARPVTRKKSPAQADAMAIARELERRLAFERLNVRFVAR